ncbi:uncharacterized protein TRIADDRAFT_53417 [Trichoplax adhaerens]|uniref:Uncharacterized protein n=1 Tax=Trichoplax adhaerens TaxID=10228 RepID=B3RP62_TRIAD|nr:predicted protein [Trichoplax adhaerens]EDV27577.1 predicted protein [Trichoplax adhaerens]|eukprot:XP_002109411.1 predicted protein [Trichoplax adhaerens]
MALQLCYLKFLERRYRWSIPRRVKYEHPKFRLKICDYMFKDEDVKLSLERISDLYGSEMQTCKMESAEEFPDEQLIKIPTKQSVQPDATNPPQKSADNSERASSMQLIVAILIGIIAIIIFAWFGYNLK